MSGLWQKHDDHVRLSVRLTPNGGRDAIDGVEEGADGRRHLKVRVTAVPENGKANKALVVLLAKKLACPNRPSLSFQAKQPVKKSSGSIPTRRISKLFIKLVD